MAHWHDFNPWARELVYLPTLEEAARICSHGPFGTAHYIQHWLKQSELSDTFGKLDPYLLVDGPLSRREREFHLGIRWGREPEEYFSPTVENKALARELFLKYGGTL